MTMNRMASMEMTPLTKGNYEQKIAILYKQSGIFS